MTSTWKRTGNDSNLLTVTAEYVFDYHGGEIHHPDQPQMIRFNAVLDNHLAAVDFVNRFPKSSKLRATSLSTYDEKIGGFTLGFVTHTIKLHEDGVNGGKNETGIKRYRSILKAAAKAGITVRFEHGGFVNSYATQEDLEAAL